MKHLLSSKTSITPIILKHEIENESGGHDGSKFSMDTLCQTFLSKIGAKD